MLRRQAGLSLITVAVLMAGLAALAMAAMFSMRYERNLFAEGWHKISGQAASASASLPAALDPAPAPAASASGLRKCVINGKTVVSNTDCEDKGRQIEIHDSRGIEPPKAPPVPKEEGAAPTAQDKLIEKATR
jgi:hypothetical protein